MIKSFRHRGLKALYKQGESRHVSPAHQEKLRDILAALDHSSRPEDMNLPGFHLHPLKGKLTSSKDTMQSRSRATGG